MYHTNLFLKDRVGSSRIFDVKVGAPVSYHHGQRGCKEPNNEEVGARVAAI